jgi:hypothetical protein
MAYIHYRIAVRLRSGLTVVSELVAGEYPDDWTVEAAQEKYVARLNDRVSAGAPHPGPQFLLVGAVAASNDTTEAIVAGDVGIVNLVDVEAIGVTFESPDAEAPAGV